MHAFLAASDNPQRAYETGLLALSTKCTLSYEYYHFYKSQFADERKGKSFRILFVVSSLYYFYSFDFFLIAFLLFFSFLFQFFFPFFCLFCFSFMSFIYLFIFLLFAFCFLIDIPPCYVFLCLCLIFFLVISLLGFLFLDDLNACWPTGVITETVTSFCNEASPLFERLRDILCSPNGYFPDVTFQAIESLSSSLCSGMT
jgi:hypothetical protein